MKVITGGAFQNKKAYVQETFGYAEEDFTDGAVCDWEDIFRAKVILHFHEYVRRMLEEGRETVGLAEELCVRNRDVVVVVNELGSGVVPVDAFDRNYRETVGRLSCELAKRAEEVHRVVCGIGMVIKHG